ncbi:3-oxo-5-alpha-steroid 4-dehydrogenase [Thalictrum thalictroides]|uniref:Steroid 5-alpha-reductase DET2 n=1 Tax=Thalictrum thalictroides TaxID=46969 RepID=A0A7J6VMR9_THATH|nr:3-oxo-5-alpha-steroid 4-dehydrogenase [Thalictrum thalictroides]
MLSSSDDETIFHYSLLSFFIIAPPTFISLRFLQAPYGKHYRKGWGPTIPPSLAWFLMESPTIWFTLLIFSIGQHNSNLRSILFISVFLFHYIHRTIIYPLRLHLNNNTNPKKSSSKGFPVSVAAMAFGFNLLNGYLQSRWISHYGNYVEESDWLFWGRFLIGLMIFVFGMVVNVRSDLSLVKLKGEDGGYKIPRGGWFEIVSCPNYFGEIVEWFGWTVMIWSWVGFGFFLYTCANLIPRAHANDIWYREKFKEYPKSRKAVIPYVY